MWKKPSRRAEASQHLSTPVHDDTKNNNVDGCCSCSWTSVHHHLDLSPSYLWETDEGVIRFLSDVDPLYTRKCKIIHSLIYRISNFEFPANADAVSVEKQFSAVPVTSHEALHIITWLYCVNDPMSTQSSQLTSTTTTLIVFCLL